MSTKTERRLKRLEAKAAQDETLCAIVNGIGRTKEEIDHDIAELRRRGLRGVIIILDR